ncbi:hypothetical protein L1987_46941 [Smallanthus sonchifolius]|uniref:Uncharacterized protein n=1 Tax=Smallanthus sonchifolius TaxID=185202 RepID=A0ACB9G284_9ASTR|nr:hypothetical protein L1987_46941 [Smallanthus sonchifolius]
MDEEYDGIVLGTCLKECILCGLFSVDGIKVSHKDINDYYGDGSTSLNLNQLWKQLKGVDAPPAELGSSKDYDVDMVPKASNVILMVEGAVLEDGRTFSIWDTYDHSDI